MNEYKCLFDINPQKGQFIESISGIVYEITSVVYSVPKKGGKKELTQVSFINPEYPEITHNIKGAYLLTDKIFKLCQPSQKTN